MAVDVAFKVVTTFVFEESAFQGAGVIQKKLDVISTTAGEAIENVKQLGAAFTINFAGGGGVLGLLAAASKAAESFKQTQLDIAGIISANLPKQKDAYKDYLLQMKESEKIMERIGKMAIKFALPSEELGVGFQMMQPVLAAKARDKDPSKRFRGDVNETSLDLVRLTQKFASTFRIPNAQYQMANVLAGAGSEATIFGQKLFAESGDVLKKHGISSMAQLNQAPMAKRVKAMTEALEKFSGQTEILKKKTETLTGGIRQMQELFFGFSSILRPLGRLVNEVLVDGLRQVVEFLNTKGRVIIKYVAKQLEGLAEKGFVPMIKKLFELRQLSTSFGRGVAVASIVLLLTHLKTFIAWLSKFEFIRSLTTWVRGLFGPLMRFGKGLGFVKVALEKIQVFFSGGGLAVLWKFFGLLKAGIATALPFVLKFSLMAVGFFAVFQGLYKGFAKFVGELVKSLRAGDALPEALKALDRIKAAFFKLIQPITDAINVISFLTYEFLSFITGFDNEVKSASKSANGFIKLLNLIGKGLEFLAGAYDFYKKTFEGIKGMFDLFTSGNVGDALRENFAKRQRREMFPQSRVAQSINARKALLDTIWGPLKESFLGKSGDKKKPEDVNKGPAVNNMTVNIKQDFKERQDPDRIAFTFTKHLQKLVENATESERGLPLGDNTSLGKTAVSF